MSRPKTFYAFTLVELLVVIAILALLAALLFPVFAGAREKARQTACLSNARQLAEACEMYVSDADGRYPLLWWAGASYPYVKNTQAYRCPDDGGHTVKDKGAEAYPLSYTININLLDGSGHTTADVTTPAQTVLLFEVSGINVQLLDPTEGVRSDAIGPQQFSGGGDGLNCDLETTGPTTLDLPGVSYPDAQYAAGLLDNHEETTDHCPTQYRDADGRHTGGGVFIAADGHAKRLRGTQVSAGYSAAAPEKDQSRAGCVSHDMHALPTQPCAAGSANGKHALTFSIK